MTLRECDFLRQDVILRISGYRLAQGCCHKKNVEVLKKKDTSENITKMYIIICTIKCLNMATLDVHWME